MGYYTRATGSIHYTPPVEIAGGLSPDWYTDIFNGQGDITADEIPDLPRGAAASLAELIADIKRDHPEVVFHGSIELEGERAVSDDYLFILDVTPDGNIFLRQGAIEYSETRERISAERKNR
tara:strand:+ start:400 stop:765 length:366 start_codon:yes stop_codon:yes gene_type:complete